MYALPYPFLFSRITFAPLLFAISCVLSLEFPSTIRTSNSQSLFLKISFLIESIVFPTPCSSFIVGSITLIFRKYHTQKTGIKDIVKRFCKKIKEKKRLERELFPLSVVCVLELLMLLLVPQAVSIAQILGNRPRWLLLLNMM